MQEKKLFFKEYDISSYMEFKIIFFDQVENRKKFGHNAKRERKELPIARKIE